MARSLKKETEPDAGKVTLKEKLKKFLARLSVGLLVGTGLVIVGPAIGAQAHTPSLFAGDTVCVTPGEGQAPVWRVFYSGKTTNVPDGSVATITVTGLPAEATFAYAPPATFTGNGDIYPFFTVQLPGTFAGSFNPTVMFDWDDGYSQSATASSAVTLTGDCTEPEVVDPQVSTTVLMCEGGPGGTVVGANHIFVLAHPAVSGHIEKDGVDIYTIAPGAGFDGAPPGGPGDYSIEIYAYADDDYVVNQNSVPASFPDPATVTADCAPIKSASASVYVATQATCTAPSTINVATNNASLVGDLPTAPGVYSLSFVSWLPAYVFPDGTSEYTAPPIEIVGPDPTKCPQETVPTATSVPGTCTDIGSVKFNLGSQSQFPVGFPAESDLTPGDHSVTVSIKDGSDAVYPDTFGKTYLLHYTVPDKLSPLDCIVTTVTEPKLPNTGGTVPSLPLFGAVLLLLAGVATVTVTRIRAKRADGLS